MSSPSFDQLDYAPYSSPSMIWCATRARNTSSARARLGRQFRRLLLASASPPSIPPYESPVERFISAARKEPPDIDVDFEHERREEVIHVCLQEIRRERGRGARRTVICYPQPLGAARGRQGHGLSADTVAALAGAVWGWSSAAGDDAGAGAGLDPEAPRLRQTLELAAELIGFPAISPSMSALRHDPRALEELVPIENAAMEDRT